MVILAAKGKKTNRPQAPKAVIVRFFAPTTVITTRSYRRPDGGVWRSYRRLDGGSILESIEGFHALGERSYDDTHPYLQLPVATVA